MVPDALSRIPDGEVSSLDFSEPDIDLNSHVSMTLTTNS